MLVFVAAGRSERGAVDLGRPQVDLAFTPGRAFLGGTEGDDRCCPKLR